MKTGTRTQVPLTSRSGSSRILRLSLRSFFSSSVSSETVVDDRAGERHHVERDVLGELVRRGHRHGVPVVHEADGVAGDGGLRLLEQLLAAGEARARHGLVGARR